MPSIPGFEFLVGIVGVAVAAGFAGRRE
ncbi:PGF-CTERM sorting domain-containing protein [Archaeoglobus sp.]